MKSRIQSQIRLWILLNLVLFYCVKLSAQAFECFTPTGSGQYYSSNSSICTTTGNYVPYYDHPDYRPIVYLNINVHFFQHLDGTGNFTEIGDGKGGSYTGYQYATDLINYCNDKLSVNCDWVYYPTNQTVPAVGPTQIRFKIYSDPANPNDKGIYFHQVADQYYYYSWDFSNLKNLFSVHGTQVIDLWIQEYPDPNYTSLGGCAEGLGYGADEIKFTNIWRNWPSQTPYSVAGLLDHETGHLLGLSHAWYNSNCPALIPGYAWNVDNNVMNYNGLNCNWSECQLGVSHEYLTNYLPLYVSPAWCTYDISKTITIHTGENILWNASRYLQGDIILESGSHLTIQCSVYLPQHASVIVKPNAVLTLDGGKLSSACGQMWAGVQVWGDYNSSQYTVNGYCAQGKIEVKNNATIENAYNGIAVWNSGYNNNPADYWSTGGIVIASNSTFKNNRRSVEYISYQNFNPYNHKHSQNFGSFTLCQFIIDDNYLGPNPFYSHITMWMVDGVRINGCSFSNASTVNSDPNRGYGIYTEDAKYTVAPVCTSNIAPCPPSSLVKTTFQGLYAGVGALNYTTVNAPYVTNSSFTNNGFGVKLSHVNYPTVILNSFDIGPNTSCPSFNGIGIEVKDCNGYCIEDNQFFHTPGGPPTASYVGAHVVGEFTNYTPTYNEIYHNQFNGITAGNQADGVNWNSSSPAGEGLCYWCNTNQNNVYDFNVTGAGIRDPQGNLPDEPAGNCFSNNGNNPNSDFNNQASHKIRYLYDLGTGCANPVYYYNIIKQGINHQNSCVDHFGGGGSQQQLTAQQITEIQQQFADNNAISNSFKSVFETLKDGGNTNDLQSDIVTSSPDQTMELRDNLLGKSPFLSHDILKTAADKYNVLPAAILFEILSANPEEMKDNDFLQYLQEKPDPLSDELIEVLQSIAGDSTHKTGLQDQIANYDTKRFRAAYLLIRNLINDSTIDFTGLRTWFANLRNINADYQIIDSWIHENNTAAALAYVDFLPQLYKFDDAALVEYNYYKQLKNLQAAVLNDNRNIFQMTQNEIDQLYDIAQSSQGTAAIQAQNVLEFAYGYSFPACIDVGSNQKSAPVKIKGATNNPLGVVVSAFPNPASNWVALSYIIPPRTVNASITLTDVHGYTLKNFDLSKAQSHGQVIWDTRNVKPGIYLYSIISDNKSKTGKITVIH